MIWPRMGQDQDQILSLGDIKAQSLASTRLSRARNPLDLGN